MMLRDESTVLVRKLWAQVWLHNPRALHFPPADGWDFSLKVALNHRAPAAPKGKAKAKATAPPAAASSAAPSTVDPPAKAAKKARLSEESEEDGFPELKRSLRSAKRQAIHTR